jgi:hypothetical protein
VRLTLGYPFAGELCQLLDEVVVVQKDRSVRADGQRMVVAFHQDAGMRPVGVACVSVIVLPFGAGSIGRPYGRSPWPSMVCVEDVIVFTEQQVAVEDVDDPHQQSIYEPTHTRFPSSN